MSIWALELFKDFFGTKTETLVVMPHDIDLYKKPLKEAGIDSFLYTYMDGGLRFVVPKEQVEQAREVIKNIVY